MSSGSRKAKKDGERARKGKKEENTAQPSTNNLGLRSSGTVRYESQLTAAEKELHEDADQYFRAIDIKNRRKGKTESSQNLRATREEVSTNVDLIIGAGKHSWPNSEFMIDRKMPARLVKDDLYKTMETRGRHAWEAYQTALYSCNLPRPLIGEEIHNLMKEQARYMYAAYKAAIEIDPSLAGDFATHCATTYYQHQKERVRTIHSYAQKLALYDKTDESVQGPDIEYGGGMGQLVEMRLGPIEPPETFEKGLESPAARREVLFTCFDSMYKNAPSTAKEAMRDIEQASKLPDHYGDHLVSCPEFLRFQSEIDESLVVHGNTPKSKGDSASALTPSLFKCYKALNVEDGIVLTHSVGLSAAARNYNSDHLKGSSGLMRSLCAQLLAHEELSDCFSLSWLTRKRREDAATKKHARISLAMFFRDLILDVANIAAAQGLKRCVRVVIDGIDRLEKDKSLGDVIAIFRGIVDELEFGPLGHHLTFKYILIHPQVSRLAIDQHPRERHVFLACNETPGESISDVMTKSQKSKGKGKREKAGTFIGGYSSGEEDETDSTTLTPAQEHELSLHLADARLFVNPQAFQYVLSSTSASLYKEKQWRKEINTKRQEGQCPAMRYYVPVDASTGEPEGKPSELSLPLWPDHVGKLSYDKTLSTPNARYQALVKALYGPETCDIIQNQKHYDAKKIHHHAKQEQFALRADLALVHPEIIHFSKRRSGGLILHVMDNDYVKSTERRVTKLFGLISTAFGTNANVMRLRYAAGCDLVHEPGTKAKIPGIECCLRQLCYQIIQSPILRNYGLVLPFIHNAVGLGKIRQGSIAQLLQTFRMLLLDIATLVHDNDTVKRQTVEVVIDCADWLEPAVNLQNLIDFFRRLLDEVRSSEVGKYIYFRYMFIHPKICIFTVDPPHLEERHLFWERNDARAISKDQEAHKGANVISSQEQIDHLIEAIYITTDDKVSRLEVSNFLLKRARQLQELKEDSVGVRKYRTIHTEGNVEATIFASDSIPNNVHDQDYDNPAKRRQHFNTAVNFGLGSDNRTALAKEERRICASQHLDADVSAIVRTLYSHKEIEWFRDGTTRSIMIHDASVPGDMIPITGELSERALAAFLGMLYFDQTRKEAIVLTHVASTFATERATGEVRDAVAIFRSLCSQLADAASKRYKKPLEMDWMCADVGAAIKDGDSFFLCESFRYLICDLARIIAKAKTPRQRVVIILDCAEIHGSPKIEFEYLGRTIRGIIDEIEVTELGQYVDLNYVVLRPVIRQEGSIGIHSIDRHVYMKDVLEDTHLAPFTSLSSRHDTKEDLGRGSVRLED